LGRETNAMRVPSVWAAGDSAEVRVSLSVNVALFAPAMADMRTMNS